MYNLIFLPTRCNGIFGGIDKPLPFSGELEPFKSLQFTIHASPDVGGIHQVNYHRKEGKSPEGRRALLTNALDVHNEFFELCFYATGHLTSKIYDVSDGFSSQISLGSYDPQKFVFCYLALVSRLGREYRAATEPVIGYANAIFNRFKLHFLTFCIPIPTSERSLRHLLSRYPHDISMVPPETRSALRINSFNESEIRDMIIEHFLHAKLHLASDPEPSAKELLLIDTPLSPNAAMQLGAEDLRRLSQKFRRPDRLQSGGFRLPPVPLSY